MIADRAASYSGGDHVFSSKYGFGTIVDVLDEGVMLTLSRPDTYGYKFAPFERIEHVDDEEFLTYDNEVLGEAHA